MVRPTEKDMKVDLISTSEGVFPYIPAQDWVETEEDWVTNSKVNPMTVDLSSYDDMSELLKDSDISVESNLTSLKKAVYNLEQLLDNSIKEEGE